MNNIQKQIDKSVGDFDDEFINLKPEGSPVDPQDMRDFIKQKQLDLIEVIKWEIEKLDRYEPDEGLNGSECFLSNNGEYIKRQSALDLLNNLK